MSESIHQTLRSLAVNEIIETEGPLTTEAFLSLTDGFEDEYSPLKELPPHIPLTLLLEKSDEVIRFIGNVEEVKAVCAFAANKSKIVRIVGSRANGSYISQKSYDELIGQYFSADSSLRDQLLDRWIFFNALARDAQLKYGEARLISNLFVEDSPLAEVFKAVRSSDYDISVIDYKGFGKGPNHFRPIKRRVDNVPIQFVLSQI